MMFWFYLVVSLIIVPLQFYNHWAISKQKMDIVYPVSMIVYALYFVTETILAFANPAQLPVLIFNIVNLWAFAMAYKGYQSLKNEKGCQ
jgi:hypothetical protein